MTLRLLFAALFGLSSVGAQVLDFSTGLGRGPAHEEPVPPDEEAAFVEDAPLPLYCEQVVRDGFAEIWERSGRGRRRVEVTMVIVRAPDGGVGVEVQENDTEVTRDTVSSSVFVNPRTALAIAHTHPDEVHPEPGPEDITKYPNFIVSSRGLHLILPDAESIRDFRKLRNGRTWSQPCDERVLERERAWLERRAAGE